MSNVRANDVGLDSLTPQLSTAYGYWQSRGTADVGPTWNDIDLFELPPAILPTTMVVDIKPNMRDNLFRFWGSELTTIHGREMTGRCPYDILPEEFGQRLLEDHARVVAMKRPHAIVYEVLGVKGYIHSHMVLRLPLFGATGDVSHIVICADYSEAAVEYFRALPISLPENDEDGDL